MSTSAPRISDTEWEIMRVIWASHPATTGEITERLAQTDPTWHPKTVRTLLGRLVEKGALTYTPDGRIFRYRPVVTEDQCVAAASESFLDRVFGGSLKPMLAHFVEREELSAEDLKDLERILARRRKTR